MHPALSSSESNTQTGSHAWLRSYPRLGLEGLLPVEGPRALAAKSADAWAWAT